MSIVGLFITTPLTAFDELNVTSTEYTPYLEIFKISLTNLDNDYGGYTGYTAKATYSIYNNIDKDQAVINFKFTGLTSSLTFDMDVADVIPDTNQIIQDSYNIIIDYFEDNDIDYAIVGASHGYSEWYCFDNDTITYCVINTGTTLITNSSGVTMVTATGIERGTFSAVAGYSYSANNPISLVGEGSQYSIVPKTLNGYYFIHYTTRYPPETFFIYSPFGDATVNHYEDSSTGINGTITNTMIVSEGQQYSFTGNTSSIYHYIESDIPINMTAKGATGDNVILSPSNKYVYTRRSQYMKTIYGVGAFWGTHVVYDSSGDDICMNIAIGDGAGGDAEHGVGQEFLSNTYSFGNTLSDFALIAPYSATTIDVSYYGGSFWVLLESFSLNGTKTSPGYAFRDGTTGVGVEGTIYSGAANNFAIIPAIPDGRDLWKFVGNYPFALVINDSTQDEMICYGWNQNNE